MQLGSQQPWWVPGGAQLHTKPAASPGFPVTQGEARVAWDISVLYCRGQQNP